MNESLIYAARSGIQKAIRRGEVSLAKTCFDIVWAEPKHRQWLKWRLPVFVFEDCWPMAGELALIQEQAKGLRGDDAYKAYRSAILKFTIAQKSKDASALWLLAVHGKSTEAYADNAEFHAMKRLASLVIDEKVAALPYETVTDILHSEFQRDLTSYEKAACNAIEKRRQSGGMVSDQWNVLSALVLIYSRGLNQTEILEMLDVQKQKYAGQSVKRIGRLPLYCFDMHTRPGLQAKNLFLKNHSAEFPLFDTPDKLMTAWFSFESAKIGEAVKPQEISFSRDARPSTLQCMWTMEDRHNLERYYNCSYVSLLEEWQNAYKKLIKFVEWSVRRAGFI